jgi:hypothetical protein
LQQIKKRFSNGHKGNKGLIQQLIQQLKECLGEGMVTYIPGEGGMRTTLEVKFTTEEGIRKMTKFCDVLDYISENLVPIKIVSSHAAAAALWLQRAE